LTLAAGQRIAGTFYVRALDYLGSVQLVVSAPGFADACFDIPSTNE